MRLLVGEILVKLLQLQDSADKHDEEVRSRSSTSNTTKEEVNLGAGYGGIGASGKASGTQGRKDEVERSFKIYKEKLQELDRWLPELKAQIRNFFDLSNSVKCIFLQIDDLYHLKRTDQAFIVDYIHRLCKDVPMYFKIATMRHASTLFADRDGQPIGAQERHDYQPINIDYTFSDFKKTQKQNWEILVKFAERVRLTEHEVRDLFKGEGF